jgi:hypothetical protein
MPEVILEETFSGRKRRKRKQAHHSGPKIHNPSVRSIRTHVGGQGVAASENRAALGAELNALSKANRSGRRRRLRHDVYKTSGRKAAKGKKNEPRRLLATWQRSPPRGKETDVITTRDDGPEAEHVHDSAARAQARYGFPSVGQHARYGFPSVGQHVRYGFPSVGQHATRSENNIYSNSTKRASTIQSKGTQQDDRPPTRTRHATRHPSRSNNRQFALKTQGRSPQRRSHPGSPQRPQMMKVPG